MNRIDLSNSVRCRKRNPDPMIRDSFLSPGRKNRGPLKTTSRVDRKGKESRSVGAPWRGVALESPGRPVRSNFTVQVPAHPSRKNSGPRPMGTPKCPCPNRD
eukprot:scaffold2534_cov328-Pavlova_lutheri.AAC.1